MDRFNSLSFWLLLFLSFTSLVGCGSGSSSTPEPVTNTISYIDLNIELKGNGSGRIYVEELNQYCTSYCTFKVQLNTTVTLQAEATNSDNQFIGWSENCDTNEEQCKLTAIGNIDASASFGASGNTSNLITMVEGRGHIKIDSLEQVCDSNCEYALASDKIITLEAVADSGSEFLSWSNRCSTSPTCEISMEQDVNVTASFTSNNQIPITLNILGKGNVEVAPLNESCESSCIYYVDPGAQITLQVAPENVSTFLNWSDNCDSSTSQCTLTLNAATTINAFFGGTQEVSNTILIKEPFGQTITNLPIQIARPFVKGEITNSPTISVAGKDITSQATIKQRYDDGSVKHAIIHFVVDELPANGQLTATISDRASPAGVPLSKSEILSSAFNFDAAIKYSFTSGDSKTISAREMLENDDFEVWAEGSVATTLILADHSSDRKYDVGSDAHRSVRPIFHVTFWKALGTYTVRFISENTNTLVLQNQSYDVDLFLGTSNQLVYSKTDILHQARTIWTKKYSTHEKVSFDLDHNIKYLVMTNSLPYFDTDRKMSEDAISAIWQSWQSKDTDLYGRGFWQTAMATAGGRPDIGLYPSWSVQWAFSGDWRLTEIALTQADLAGAWPMHMREGKSGLTLDFSGNIDGLGRIVSLAPGARPTHWIERPDWHEIADADKITPVASLTSSIWKPDNAHHPDIGSLQYLLTGERFYLETMMNSAAYVTSNNNAKAFGYRYGRGETGSEGLLYSGEVRGQAWALRTRVHAFDIIPDTWPEKAYFNQLNINAIVAFEGLFGLDNSYPEYDAIYRHSQDIVAPRAFGKTTTPSSLGFWDEGVASASYVSDDSVDTNLVNQAIAPWMQNFVTISLGRAKELGYKTDSLLRYSATYLNGMLNNTSLPREMFSAYITPTLDQNDAWFTSIENIVNTYTNSYIDLIGARLDAGADSEHGYYSIGMAAVAYSYSQDNAEAWLYIRNNVASKSIYNDNPKWAILPRPENSND